MSMNDDASGNLEIGNNVDAVGADQSMNPDESFSGESCSKACRLHWPMRLASIVIIAALAGIYGLLHFSPELANATAFEISSAVGLESSQSNGSLSNGKDSECPFCALPASKEIVSKDPTDVVSDLK